MDFSIVTPSFRQSDWLKLCIASVADQGVRLEHIVQDAGSDDGTLDWLPQDSRVRAFVETDQGMYDAINRGMRRARGGILAYLNCDEQYLPGALNAVQDAFQKNPNIDVVFADAVIVDTTGNYVCHRGALIPTPYHTLVSGNLSILTCATFFRRRLIDEEGLVFDDRLRAVGDADWISRLLKRGVSMAVLRHFTSAFTETKTNMGLGTKAREEGDRRIRSAPLWAQKLRFAIVIHYRLRKLFAGLYSQKPFEYEVYTAGSPEQRLLFKVTRPTSRWKLRAQSPLG